MDAGNLEGAVNLASFVVFFSFFVLFCFVFKQRPQDEEAPSESLPATSYGHIKSFLLTDSSTS